MLKLLYLDDTFEKKKWKYDRTRFFIEDLLIKGLQRDSHTNRKFFLNVKMKNEFFGEKKQAYIFKYIY